jgi:hypothetical protein
MPAGDEMCRIAFNVSLNSFAAGIKAFGGSTNPFAAGIKAFGGDTKVFQMLSIGNTLLSILQF